MQNIWGNFESDDFNFFLRYNPATAEVLKSCFWLCCISVEKVRGRFWVSNNSTRAPGDEPTFSRFVRFGEGRRANQFALGL